MAKFNYARCSNEVNGESSGCDENYKKPDNFNLIEYLKKMKNNRYAVLRLLKLTDINTGETYTLEQIDKLLNN